MRIVTEPCQAGTRSDTLLVLLPPSLSSIDDFYQHGFIDAVRQRQLPVDLLLADATAQQVMDNSVVAELHAQVLQPAIDSGYRHIWLAGISIGAFSALLCAAQHAELLAGICLLAPYPGTHDVLGDIRSAGGAARWHLNLAQQPAQSFDDERLWWHWLGQQSMQAQSKPPVYLCTGSTDRFLKGQQMIADLLPKAQVRLLRGGHDWPTWSALWDDWLDHSPWLATHTITAK